MICVLAFLMLAILGRDSLRPLDRVNTQVQGVEA